MRRQVLTVGALVALCVFSSDAFATNLGGKVWCDQNEDGILDAGEEVIGGTVTVTSIEDPTQAVSATIDANGCWFVGPIATVFDVGVWDFEVCLDPGATDGTPFAIDCGDTGLPDTTCSGADLTTLCVTVSVDNTDPDGNFDGSQAIDFRYNNCDEPPPPPPGVAGCTPGYWKQDHHLDSWPVDPDATFAEIFGSDAFGSLTLLEVVRLTGGELHRLGAHAVAALLNAITLGDEVYGLSAEDVIDAFNMVADLEWDEQEVVKDLFEELNEQGCPLD